MLQIKLNTMRKKRCKRYRNRPMYCNTTPVQIMSPSNEKPPAMEHDKQKKNNKKTWNHQFSDKNADFRPVSKFEYRLMPPCCPSGKKHTNTTFSHLQSALIDA